MSALPQLTSLCIDRCLALVRILLHECHTMHAGVMYAAHLQELEPISFYAGIGFSVLGDLLGHVGRLQHGPAGKVAADVARWLRQCARE